MAVEDLTGAAEAFLDQFFGRKNWLLWTSLRKRHGFSTNQEFAAWMLQVVERLTPNSVPVAKPGPGDSIDEANNNITDSSNNNLEKKHMNGHVPGMQLQNGFYEEDETDDDYIFDASSETSAGKKLVNGTGRVDKISPGSDGSLDLSVVKQTSSGDVEEEMNDDDGVNEDDKPLNVQQFNKGGVRIRNSVEQLYCNACCMSYPTEASYNVHKCKNGVIKDRRKSSEPSRFVPPSGLLLEEDEGDAITGYSMNGRFDGYDDVVGCNVCARLFPSINELQAHDCKREMANGNGVGGDDSSPLTAEYWDGEVNDEEADLSIGEDYMGSPNGKLTLAVCDSEMEGIVGSSSSLSLSGVSSSSLSDPRMMPCGMCGKMLMGNRAVVRHIRTVHMRIRKFHCEICDRRFARNEHLKRHKCSRRSRLSV